MSDLSDGEVVDEVLSVLSRYTVATTGLMMDEIPATRSSINNALRALRTSGVIVYVHEPTALWTKSDSDVPVFGGEADE